MRVLVLSDLHLEFGPFLPPKVDCDLVILAGDTQPKLVGVRWAMETFQDVPVLYVAGNHEFYRERHPRLTEKMRILASGSTVTILENDSVEIGGWRFFGATLWTDFQLYGDVERGFEAAMEMNDFKLIRQSPSMKPFRPLIARMLFRETKEQLVQFLQSGPPDRSVVITHHAPSIRSVPDEFRLSHLSAAFASDLEPVILAHQPALWVHGHIHQHQDYFIGKTRILANPRGYVGHEEGTAGFVPDLVVDLLAQQDS